MFHIVEGLTISTTYYFRVWVSDDEGLWSGISNGTTCYVYTVTDTTPPTAITTLTGKLSTVGSVILQWISPGDDGITGEITGGYYHINYATYTVEWTTETAKIHISTDTIAGQLQYYTCLLYTSPSPRDLSTSRMPSSA